jgi:hypothetical protein
MFFDELRPVMEELTQHPVAFLGGFFSGVFRLNLSDDPVKSWLEQQGASSNGATYADPESNGNRSSSGPQSISID